MYFRGEAVDRFGGKCSEWSSAGLILLKFSNGSESSSCEGAGLYVVQRLTIPTFSFFFGTSHPLAPSLHIPTSLTETTTSSANNRPE